MTNLCSSKIYNYFSKQVLIKITHAFDWHVEGEIIEKDLPPVEVDENYVDKMVKDLEEEKVKLEEKKKLKL